MQAYSKRTKLSLNIVESSDLLRKGSLESADVLVELQYKVRHTI